MTLHIALCFFPCSQGQDVLHLGRYGSEGLACLPSRQHPCPGAEAFPKVQTCYGQGGRCPCYACVPFDSGRPLFVGFMVGTAALVVVSAVAWLLLVCWLRCFRAVFTSLSAVQSSQVQFVNTIMACLSWFNGRCCGPDSAYCLEVDVAVLSQRQVPAVGPDSWDEGQSF